MYQHLFYCFFQFQEHVHVIICFNILICFNKYLLLIIQEKYQVAKILEDAKYSEAINYGELVPKHKKKR